MHIKNVLAVHDISCVGRCSLTVALPIISGSGVECRCLPTALLSTHTGGFSGFTYLDLTDEMRKILAAWKPLNLSFDGIYSGFLGSFEQIDIIKDIISTYRKSSTKAIIDPVMADDGKIYPIFNQQFVDKMAQLVPLADVLIPNITEALLLAKIPYQKPPYSIEFIKTVAKKLNNMGASDMVITGVSLKDGELGCAVCQNGGIELCLRERIDGYYHGTGDIFGSALTGALVFGKGLFEAAESAVDFVISSIKSTPADADKKYGVNFESVMKAQKN